MKKLLVLLAALSLVACSSTPKEEVAPSTTETVNEQSVDSTAIDAPAEEMTVEETTTEEPAMEEAPAVEEPEANDTTYTIAEGDNLFRIGLKYNMSWEKLAEENNISDPNVITSGEELTIPTK